MYYVSYGIACAIMFMYDLFVCPWGEELGAHNWRPIKSLGVQSALGNRGSIIYFKLGILNQRRLFLYYKHISSDTFRYTTYGALMA